MNRTELQRFKDEKASENTCDNCGQKMKTTKRKQKNRFSKKQTIHDCPFCGHRFRARTNNEILRDIGLKD